MTTATLAERESAYLRSWRSFYHPVATVEDIDRPTVGYRRWLAEMGLRYL